jgi:hypothetical protein
MSAEAAHASQKLAPEPSGFQTISGTSGSAPKQWPHTHGAFAVGADQTTRCQANRSVCALMSPFFLGLACLVSGEGGIGLR